MLNADKFCGDEQARKRAVDQCWNALIASTGDAGIPGRGSMELVDPEKQRHVSFYDTEDCALYRGAGFILRLRRPMTSKKDWDVTLKHRSGDWVRSTAQVFRPRSGDDVKFEEDIKVSHGSGGYQFVPLFSRSAEAEIKEAPTKIKEALRLFADLDRDVLPDALASLSTVSDFSACEEVFEGGVLQLSKSVEAECAIILWSDRDKSAEGIVAAEFSIRYDFKGKGRSPKVASRAWRAFLAICSNNEWANPKGESKTAFVYSYKQSKEACAPVPAAPGGMESAGKIDP